MKKTEKFKILVHNGPVFPKQYQYEDFIVKVNDKIVKLSVLAEEMLYSFAKKYNTVYVEDSTYVKNFWKDLRNEVPSEVKNSNFPNDWNFKSMIVNIEKQKEVVKNRTKKEKEQLKKEKEAYKEQFGFATVDGQKIELGNYVIEPAGIFQGRGKHPKRGSWKKQIFPEDITINCTSNTPLPPNGHSWKEVISNKNGMYVCYWFENVMNCRKSIMFARTSAPIQKKEEQKFDKAVLLAQNWNRMEKHIDKNLTSSDKKTREVSTVCKLIMDLGIRVGDEKGEGTADTVGASSLRKKHVSISNNTLTLNFLGKDSVRYKNSVKVSKELINNVKEFMSNGSDVLFPHVNSTVVREFLNEVVKNVSAKTFRTAKASMMISEKLSPKTKDSLKQFKEANIEVAKLLNHKKTVNKTFTEGVKKLSNKMNELRKLKNTDISNKKRSRVNRQLKQLKTKLELRKKTKDVAPGTSLTNYIDPRLVYSWTKERDVEISKIYTSALIKKFSWAEGSNHGFYKKYNTK